MASVEYERMMEEGKVYVLPDVFPWSGVHRVDSSIAEGIVQNCTVNTGSNISTADIKFPKKVFGDHIRGLTPIKICINNINNVRFRGFIIEENGVLNESDDSVTVRAQGYKWYFAKCTRIRGRWFTSDDAIPVPYGSPNTIGTGKLKYEMFRGPLIRDDGRSGYVQDEPCIFNENSLPTCLTKTKAGNKSIFKYRRMQVKDELQYTRRYNYGTNYWTYSSILSHIVYWWLDPYAGSGTQIKISNNSFAQLSRLSSEDETPMDLSIEGMNPLDAINEVVGQIPGKWIWYLRYTGTYVFIELRNLNDPITLKKLHIGDGSKQAENPANVASANVVRNWEESSSFLVLKGGKLRFTTTVELQPVWEPNTLLGVDNLPFETEAQFKKWKSYINNKEGTKFTEAERDIFERAFKYYCIPKEGEFLTQALEEVDFKTSSDVRLTGRLGRMYAVIEKELKQMFAHQVFLERELDAPDHPEFDNPIFFAYDDYKNISPKETVADDDTRKIILLEDNVNFDSDTGLVIFGNPQYCQIANMQPAKSEGVQPEEGEDKDIDTTADTVTKAPESIGNVTSIVDGDYPLISRRIFCTLTIVLDLPYVVGDDIFGLYYSEGGNFSRYVDFEGNDLRIHANAFYPVMPDKNVTVTPEAYTLATQSAGKEFPVEITSEMCEKALYPAEYMQDYEMYPDNNDRLLLQKLDNLKSSINKHTETIDADLGVLDLTYELGDIIVAIENSATENVGSGYYGLRDYVSQLSWSLEGDNEGYTTRLTATNDIEFTPQDFEKVVANTIRRPSVLRGNFKSDSFLEVEE